MNFNYKIPIIPQNLDKHETIIQISEAFQYLSDVTDAFFSQINKKIETDQKKISELGDRICAVGTKIVELKGSKTAIQVFSSSKYPASEVNQDYISIFHDCPKVEYKRYPVKYKNFHSTHEPLEKLQLYHVNVTQEAQGKNQGIPLEKNNFVNDLHLTTSGKYLYKKYETNEALNIQTKDDISKIDEAPYSISDKANLSRSVTQDYMYAPQIGDVPALEVPLDLPDLPGVADNVHYENDYGPAIAPSAFIESLNSLPNIETSEIEQISIPDNISIPPPPPLTNFSELQSPKDLSTPLNIPTLEPEIPKPPLELPKPPENLNNIDPTPNEKNIPKPTVEKTNEVNPKPVEPPPATDLRSSLMEAIRNAGGSGKAKLRSVASREEKANEANSKQVRKLFVFT